MTRNQILGNIIRYVEKVVIVMQTLNHANILLNLFCNGIMRQKNMPVMMTSCIVLIALFIQPKCHRNVTAKYMVSKII